MQPILNVITCSTRPGASARRGRLVRQVARAQGEFEVVACDLKELALPLLDEPEHPRTGKYSHAHTLRWSKLTAAADAYVFVLPEYNFGPPASLLNALSYLSAEWAYKPAAFVSYGGMSGGIRAVQVAKQLMTTQKIVPLLEAVAVQNVGTLVDAEGKFQPAALHGESAAAMLKELARWAAALRPCARRRPDAQGVPTRSHQGSTP
ncbi:NAD(P)H-dependent oxidoreductase [Ottowia beijingensis]|uniref:NAD(P)H-dependent oxidoreductase n=1 Tax=Ottowia beijingensis TaxID=1207057 RepID=A0A853IZP6_9BURK|nr:NAD(P)H-dependent oxidoreductase [Ottowia beijingensis]NZA03418.1 NAD(P)H-dependent oxidoreductase [Ottowia beijingensis]